MLVNRHQVALFWLPDNRPAVYAIAQRDPVAGSNVLSRGMLGEVRGEPVVVSPIGGRRFRLRDGRCPDIVGLRVPVYPSRVSDGRVWLSL